MHATTFTTCASTPTWCRYLHIDAIRILEVISYGYSCYIGDQRMSNVRDEGRIRQYKNGKGDDEEKLTIFR